MFPELGFVKWTERKLARSFSGPISSKLACSGYIRINIQTPKMWRSNLWRSIFYEICLNFVKIFLHRLDLRLFGVLMLILTPILLMTNETKYLILWLFEFLRTALAPQSVDLIGQINWKMLGSQLLLLPSYKPRTQRSQYITFLDLSKRSDYIIRCFMAPLFLTRIIWD